MNEFIILLKYYYIDGFPLIAYAKHTDPKLLSDCYILIE